MTTARRRTPTRAEATSQDVRSPNVANRRRVSQAKVQDEARRGGGKARSRNRFVERNLKRSGQHHLF